MKLTRSNWKLKNKVIFRNIYYSDLKKILKWRNSLKVREISLDNAYISYDKHLKWYKKIQTNNLYHSFLVSLKNNILGTVNIKKIKPGVSKWSIYKNLFLKRHWFILSFVVLNKIFYDLKMSFVYATIYLSNNKSINFHKSLGFNFYRNINSKTSQFILRKSSWEKNKTIIKEKINKKYNIVELN